MINTGKYWFIFHEPKSAEFEFSEVWNYSPDVTTTSKHLGIDQVHLSNLLEFEENTQRHPFYASQNGQEILEDEYWVRVQEIISDHDIVNTLSACSFNQNRITSILFLIDNEWVDLYPEEMFADDNREQYQSILRSQGRIQENQIIMHLQFFYGFEKLIIPLGPE